MNTTLLIMAAGLGSRYGGNKQIDRIGPNGEILMEYSIHDAAVLCRPRSVPSPTAPSTP